MKRRAALFGLIIALGCGGSGGSVDNSPLLTGTLNVESFTIPAGQSRTASGDVVINATKGIEIAGTLIIPDGAAVALFAAEDVVLSGTISSAGSQRPTSKGLGRLNTLVAVGANVRSAGGHSLGEGANAMFATRGAGTVTISGAITLPPGRNARGSGENGATGGAILIGTPEVIAEVTGRGQQAQAPANVVLSAVLTAGDGGAGFDDTRGSASGRNITGTGSAGGDGGDVAITCGALVVQGSGKLMPGVGGRGGWVGRAPGGSGFLTAQDGQSRGQNGGDAYVTLGKGGDAGKRTVTAGTVTGAVNQDVVLGGACGSAYVKAGNGGLVAAGGGAYIQTPKPSKNSDASQRAVSGTVEVTGGYGGVGDPSSGGGVGGKIEISNASFGPIPLAALVVDDALRGGNGFDGCAATPQGPGTVGGAGGSITAQGVPVQPIARSGNGGDGGNYLTGVAPAGGQKGTVGRDGLPGRGCAEAARVLVLAKDYMLKNGLVLTAGTQVSMSRVRGGHVGQPEAGCSSEHVHGPITIDGYGLFEDTDPGGCGHGQLN